MLLVAAVLALPGCASRAMDAAQREQASLEAALLEREDERRFGPDDFFEKALEQGPDDRRARALLAIGRIGDLAGLPLIYRHLNHYNYQVRAMAAFAVGEMLDAATLEEAGLRAPADAAGKLIALLGDSAMNVRLRATEALGKMKASSAVAALEKVLPQPDQALNADQELWVGTAMTALFRVGGPQAETLAGAYLQSPHPEVAWRSANALTRLKSTRFFSELRVLLQSPHATVRAGAVRALATDPEKPVALVAPLLQDPDLPVRINALRTLGIFAGPEAAQAISGSLQQSQGESTSRDLALVAHLQALGQSAAPQAAETVEPFIFQQGPRANAAVLALAKLLAKSSEFPEGNPRFFDSTASFIIEDFWAAKNWCLALGAHGSAEATEQLRAIVAERSTRFAAELQARVKVLAVDALIEVNPPGLKQELLAATGSQDPIVRAHALAGLAREPMATTLTLGDLETAHSAWLAHKSEIINDARIALLRLLEKTPLPQAAPYAETMLAEAPDRNSRQLAARIVRLKTGRDVSERIGTVRVVRPPYYYRDLILFRKHPAHVIFETDRGKIHLELNPEVAPLTVANFLELAARGFFDSQSFHRVVPNFVVQGGDPREDMEGGPGYSIRCEINATAFQRGTLGMALSGKDTGGSQFFICHSAQPHLDGGYTSFGRVVAGMEIIDQMTEGDRIVRAVALPDRPRWWGY
ncbi:MAG: peptidylprolyl isomerase [Acidobacteriota bacterium]